jgi:signal transduction histidine kinase
VTVARRLGVALAAHLALLVLLLVYHVRTIHRAVTTAHELSDVSARVVLSTARQRALVQQMDESAAKYSVTRDPRYAAKHSALRASAHTEGASLAALAVTGPVAGARDALLGAWTALAPLPAVPRASAVEAHRADLATVHDALVALGAAAESAMRSQLADASAEAARAERVSWWAAGIALLLAVGTGVALVRSVTVPLQRLVDGTREVARGRFGFRLDTARGDDFARVAAAFNVMTERLGTVDRMKQEFVSTVSHDLKSPLASLRETTTLLLEEVPGPLTDTQRRLLTLQADSASRLAGMIAKLLDLSRIESGAAWDRRPVAVPPLLASLAEHGSIAGRDRRIAVVAAPTPPEADVIIADADRLHTLLDNLVENALKFAPPASVVELAVVRRGARLCFTVGDRGPGVAVADRERIFERFTQSDAGRAVPGRGVGLGLAICRGIAQAHGGSIVVEPRDGGGALFVVELPAPRDAAPDSPIASASTPAVLGA